ncbi:hypothetical protein LSAT2_014187, partial [Lamellibrachia satsuma]
SRRSVPTIGKLLSAVGPPGSRSRRSSYRGAALHGQANGEPLSTIRPSGSRSRRSENRSDALEDCRFQQSLGTGNDGPAT